MSRRILTIDDSDIAQDVIRATLTDFGFDDVVGYLDPIDALSAIGAAETSADLILLDIMMPGMDGIELCARIRGLEKWSDVPIIMLTSRKDMESLTDAFLAGANDYVTKPFDRIELQARIRSCLRLKSEMDRRRASDRRSGDPSNLHRARTLSVGSLDDDLGLMAGHSVLMASLQALPADKIGKLGLIAFRVDDPDDDRRSGSDDPSIVRTAARILGDLEIAAGDIFGHWDAGIFCLASTRKSEAMLVRLAERFIHAFGSSSTAIHPTQNEGCSISAGIVPPGGAETIAAGLADAIRTGEQASRAASGSVHVYSRCMERQ